MTEWSAQTCLICGKNCRVFHNEVIIEFFGFICVALYYVHRMEYTYSDPFAVSSCPSPFLLPAVLWCWWLMVMYVLRRGNRRRRPIDGVVSHALFITVNYYRLFAWLLSRHDSLLLTTEKLQLRLLRDGQLRPAATIDFKIEDHIVE